MKFLLSYFLYFLSKFIIQIILKFKFVFFILFIRLKLINFDYFLYLLYVRVAYFGNLRSDLEFVNKISLIRSFFIGNNFVPKKKFKYKQSYHLGFIGNVSKGGTFSLNNFKKNSNFKFFIFNFNKTESDYINSEIHFKKNLNFLRKHNISYINYKNDGYFYEKSNQQDFISKKINNLNLDILIFNTGIRHLGILDKISVSKIVSINHTSIFVPHSKIDIQSFQQPPWPYKIKDNKIYNFSKKTIINIKVSSKLFLYNPNKLNINLDQKTNHKKNVILWYGNLKKIADNSFLEVLSQILKKHTKLELHIYGKDTANYQKYIYNYFKKKGVNNYFYKGKFDSSPTKNFISSFNRTILIPNSFRMSGGRITIEAYSKKIPIVNYDLPFKSWKFGQNNQYYKIYDLFVKEGTASSTESYINIVNLLLTDKHFYNSLIKLQSQMLKKISSNKFFFNSLTKILKINKSPKNVH